MTRKRQDPEERRRRVLEEVQRRSEAGASMSSDANRGDWLFTAAVRSFGSWGASLEAAGYAHDDDHLREMSAAWVLSRIQELLGQSERLLARDHTALARAARQHFGGWKAAVEAAGGGSPAATKWTPDAVVNAIRAEAKHGRPLNAMAVVARRATLYAAARRRFGSWGAALQEAGVTALPAAVAKEARAATRRPPGTQRRSCRPPASSSSWDGCSTPDARSLPATIQSSHGRLGPTSAAGTGRWCATGTRIRTTSRCAERTL